MALSLAGLAPATASTAPPNDSIADATVIGTMPFHDYIPDMSAATWDWAIDPTDCGLDTDHNVWYQIQTDSDVAVAFDVAVVRTWVDVAVYTGDASGPLTQVACSGQTSSGLVFNATADTHYYVMIKTDGWSGPLDLNVFQAAAPTATVTVNPTAVVDRGSNITVSGTVAVSGLVTSNGGGMEAGPPGFSGTVTQVFKRINTISADIGVSFAAPMPASVKWSVTPVPTGGGFAQGYATVRLSGSFCNVSGCSPVSILQVVRVVKK